MSINKLSLVVIGLITACTSAEEQEKVVYVEPEEMALNRSTQDRAATLTELSFAYYKLGKYNYAEENLLRSLELDKNNATTYQIFALIEQRSKNPEKAQYYFDKALKLKPDDYGILTAYAVFLYKEQRHKEAVIELNRIVNAPFYERKWVAYSYLGLYDLEKNQQKTAEIKFYKALRINPQYSLALYEMARIRYAKGRMMSARAYIERYFSSAEKSLAALELAIKIEAALQSYDLVEEYQLQLVRSFPFSAAAEKIKLNH